MSLTKFPTEVETKVGAVEYESIEEKLSEKQLKHYGKYSPEDRFQTGTYAAMHDGPTLAVKKSSTLFLVYVKVMQEVSMKNTIGFYKSLM